MSDSLFLYLTVEYMNNFLIQLGILRILAALPMASVSGTAKRGSVSLSLKHVCFLQISLSPPRAMALEPTFKHGCFFISSLNYLFVNGNAGVVFNYAHPEMTNTHWQNQNSNPNDKGLRSISYEIFRRCKGIDR